MSQPGAGYLRLVQRKPLKLRQSFKLSQPDIGYLCPAQREPLKLRQSFNLSQPGVGYLRPVQGEPSEFCQPFKVNKPGVGQPRRFGTVYPNGIPELLFAKPHSQAFEKGQRFVFMGVLNGASQFPQCRHSDALLPHFVERPAEGH